MVDAWDTLGIAPTSDEGAIRKAYAARAREWRPESHPREFALLREAYEALLRAAREEIAALEQEPVGPQAEAATPVHADPAQAAVHAEVGDNASAKDAKRPYAAAQALVEALGRCYSEQGERDAVALLYEHHASLSEQTIDARLEWEVVLLHSLLTAATPPVALVFEADRLLRWREREHDVVQMLGQDAVPRLNTVLEIAWEAMYARHFCPNRWYARLFGTRPLRWFGMMSQVMGARRTQAYWTDATQRAGMEPLQQMLDTQAQARISGLMLLSTDVLLAAVLALLVWLQAQDPMRSPWQALGMSAAVFAGVLPMPLLARWLRRTAPVQKVLGWRQALSGIVWFIAGAVLFGIGMVAAMSEGPATVRVAGTVLVALMLALLLLVTSTGLWICLAAIEVLLARPWIALQRLWGLHAFYRVRDNLGVPTWQEQLRRLPRAGWDELQATRAARKQEAQRREAQPFTPAPSSSFNWWWALGTIFLLQFIARLGS
ncbi:MAG TPA: hypothetical protein VHL79_02770 [Ramlibacter sp.]|nr:hypothetical protein [Ramlibacter sp.]